MFWPSKPLSAGDYLKISNKEELNAMFGGGNDLFILLLLICCCGNKDNGCGCGCGIDRRNGDCCDLILWFILFNCICGDKNSCCK